MANRHRIQKRAAGGRTLWNAKGSGTAGAIHAKHGFKAGGTVETGKAAGGQVKARGDRFARGGRTGGGKSPYSSAHFGGHAAHAGAPHAGGATKKAAGGAVAAKAKAFRHGGKCEEDEGDDEEEEEEGHARGGHVKHKTGGGPTGSGAVPRGKVYSYDEAMRASDESPVTGEMRGYPLGVSDPGLVHGDPYMGGEKRGGGVKKK